MFVMFSRRLCILRDYYWTD